jgi:hypothetical protein
MHQEDITISNIYTYIYVYIYIKFQCIKQNLLIIKDQIVWERVGNTLEVIGIGKDFLNRTPAAQQLRESVNKWDLIKLKSFCTTKEMVSKLMRPPTE